MDKSNQEGAGASLKRRTHVIRIFPNEESCLRLIRALAVEIHEDWIEAHRYLRYGLVADPAFDLLRLSVSSLDRPEGEPGRRIVDAKLDEGGLALAQRLVVALESDCFDVDAHPLVLGGGEGEWGWVIE